MLSAALAKPELGVLGFHEVLVMSVLRDLADQSDVKFGTSGVRGLVVNMTDSVCYAYTQAFLSGIAGDARQIVIGHDLRPSSPRLVAACIRAIENFGRKAVFVGALPTPALAYYCARNNTPGIMVTGSHIPFDRNGIKFYRADGEISKGDEKVILDAKIVDFDALSPSAPPVANPKALNAYIERYIRFFGEGILAGKRVAVYEHSSVARDVLRTILEQLGAQVLPLGRTETFVPIDTEAVRQEDILQAKTWAQEYAFDAILSTDGDADRPLIGDETGTWMRGDVVGILCAQYLDADVVVTPVSSNTAVERCESFKQVLRTKIGSPYVIAGMQAAQRAHGGVIVGYEANGGFLMGTDIEKEGVTMMALPTRDAILPMLALLAMAGESGCALSKLTAKIPSRFTASDRIQQVPIELSHKLIETLGQNAKQAAVLMAPDSGPIVSRDTTDGLRLTFKSGDVVHLRPSGNAPELRCYSEANGSEDAIRLCSNCLDRISIHMSLKTTV